MESSPEIKEIAEALALAQAEVDTASKDRINPHFGQRYATLASVWDACRAALTKHGISVLQSPTAEGARVTLTTMLMHKSGQWFRDVITLQARDASPQAVGSAITYARRYALSAMASVAPDDDDDANSAQPEASKTKTKAQERPGFSTGVPFDQHRAEQAPPPAMPKAGVETRPQVDHGDFEDVVTTAVIADQGKKKSGEAWTLYRVETKGHGSFSTFDSVVFDEARLAVTLGHPVLVRSEATPKGPKVNGFGPVEVNAAA